MRDTIPDSGMAEQQGDKERGDDPAQRENRGEFCDRKYKINIAPISNRAGSIFEEGVMDT